jgi:CHAT domain-containing protein
LLDAALAFQNQAVAASLEVRETGAPAQAYIQRGMLQAAAGRTAEAGADLTAGRAELDRFHGGTRPYLAAEMRILEAALVIEKQPARARTLLQEAAATIEPLSPGRVPELRLALGRAARQLGDTVLASKELERGINYLEGQRVRIVDESLRIALFGTAQALYTERLDLALQTGDATAAFDFSERGRARALLDTTGPGGAAALHSAAVDDVRRWLPSATAFIEYVTLTDRVVAWIITRDVVVRRESVCTSARLAEAARALRRDHGGGERAAFAGTPSQEEAARTLHDVLIRPLEPQLAGVSHLIISPDTVLHDIPFAALQDRRTGRWLVMDFDIQLSPSASWLLTTAGSSPAASAPAPLKFLSVGDPQFDARAYDQLPRLPDAGREAEAVSALFPGGETLTGRGATRSALIRRLPTVDVFHFAGHAVANADAPEMSYLLLAPDHEGDDGRLRATDLRGQRLSRLQLVVLAGCRTAGGAATFGEGGLHLARSFLAAGARAVLATLWDVDDASTRAVLLDFHRALRAGEPPAAALQRAQLARLSSGQPADRQIDHWAPFVLIGASDKGTR